MHRIVEEHGKQLINQLIDLILITKEIDEDDLYKILLENKKITRNTKAVHYNYYIEDVWAKEGTQWIRTGDKWYKLSIRNSRNQIMYIAFKNSEIPSIMEDLSSCD